MFYKLSAVSMSSPPDETLKRLYSTLSDDQGAFGFSVFTRCGKFPQQVRLGFRYYFKYFGAPFQPFK